VSSIAKSPILNRTSLLFLPYYRFCLAWVSCKFIRVKSVSFFRCSTNFKAYSTLVFFGKDLDALAFSNAIALLTSRPVSNWKGYNWVEALHVHTRWFWDNLPSPFHDKIPFSAKHPLTPNSGAQFGHRLELDVKLSCWVERPSTLSKQTKNEKYTLDLYRW